MTDINTLCNDTSNCDEYQEMTCDGCDASCESCDNGDVDCSICNSSCESAESDDCGTGDSNCNDTCVYCNNCDNGDASCTISDSACAGCDSGCDSADTGCGSGEDSDYCGNCDNSNQGCDTGCEVSCQNCEGVCQIACEGVCQTTCEASCQDCEGACEDGCEVSCENCEGACEDGCEVNCEDGCEIGCQDCQSTCEAACQTYDSCDNKQTCLNNQTCNICDALDTPIIPDTFTIAFDYVNRIDGSILADRTTATAVEGSFVIPEPTSRVITKDDKTYVLLESINVRIEGLGSYNVGDTIQLTNKIASDGVIVIKYQYRSSQSIKSGWLKTYDGTNFSPNTNVASISGILPIEKGGTGVNSLEQLRELITQLIQST